MAPMKATAMRMPVARPILSPKNMTAPRMTSIGVSWPSAVISASGAKAMAKI
jgi:hypothetical protein